MAKFRRIFFIVLLLAVLLSAGISFARELEVTYPAVGNVPGPSSTRTLLPDYVKYIFNFAVAISGLIIFGSMVFAGFQYVTSAGNPTTMSSARARIGSSFIGAIIILASYLLLNTINPQLVVINPILGTNEGVIVYDSLGSCNSGMGNPESQEALKPDKNYLKFGVSSGSLEGLNNKAGAIWLFKPITDLIVNLYPKENWGGPGVQVVGQADTCIASPLISSQSIELAWQNPGVYLCKVDGKTCSVYNSSQPKLADGFEDKVTSVRFKNAGDIQYGAVLHEARNYGKTCKEFFSDASFPASPGNIFPGEGVSSITVFLQSNIPQGAGVTLYEEIDYKGGQKTLTVGSYPDFRIISWDNGAVGSINREASSIKINGDYLALLFDWSNYNSVCEVFRDDDPNLNKNTGNHINEDRAQSAKIIPIRR